MEPALAAYVPNALQERIWLDKFTLRLLTLDRLAFTTSVAAPIKDLTQTGLTPELLESVHLVYRPRLDEYLLNKERIMRTLGEKFRSPDNFEEFLWQWIEVSTVAVVRSRAYHKINTIHLRSYAETMNDHAVPAVVKKRLSENEGLQSIHRSIAHRQMRAEQSRVSLFLDLDLGITRLLAQEAHLAQRGDDYIVSLIRH